MRFIGIDVSIAATGYAIINEEECYLEGYGIIPSKKTKEPDVQRFSTIVDTLFKNIKFKEGDLVLIEDYAFSAKGQITRIAELTGMIKKKLWDLGLTNVFICSPTTCKKFVTGKGNSDKQLILKYVFKRWDFDTDNDNEADAFSLATLLYCAMVLPETLTKTDKEAIAALDKKNGGSICATREFIKEKKQKRKAALRKGPTRQRLDKQKD